MTRTAEDYLDLPYHCVFIHDRSEDGEEGYVAEVEELPGCLSQGRTIAEAADHLRDAMLGWIAVMLQDGRPIPEPRSEPSYSGKFVVRLAPSLHETVAKEAEHEGISLNQFVSNTLAGATNWRRAPESYVLEAARRDGASSHGAGEQQTEHARRTTRHQIADQATGYPDSAHGSAYDMPIEQLATILAERVKQEARSSR